MRKNQVNIVIDRFGDEASNGQHEQISIYADSNNIFEALIGAYSMAVEYIGNPAVGKSINRTMNSELSKDSNEDMGEVYYENHRLKVVKNQYDKYDVYDSKYGKITHKNVDKSQADERIEQVTVRHKKTK